MTKPGAVYTVPWHPYLGVDGAETEVPGFVVRMTKEIARVAAAAKTPVMGAELISAMHADSGLPPERCAHLIFEAHRLGLLSSSIPLPSELN